MNWGYRILTAFLLGVAFIMFFVINSMRMNTDMVEADYYSKELQHESHMQAVANLSESKMAARLELTKAQVQLLLDTSLANSIDRGEVHFYCAANAGNDRKYAMGISNTGRYSFNLSDLKGSKYTVKISFESHGVSYYKEEVLFLNQ